MTKSYEMVKNAGIHPSIQPPTNQTINQPMILNSLPNNKILDWSKFKAYADEKTNSCQDG